MVARLPHLGERTLSSGDGIIGHSQIVKEASHISGEPIDGSGDAVEALGFEGSSEFLSSGKDSGILLDYFMQTLQSLALRELRCPRYAR